MNIRIKDLEKYSGLIRKNIIEQIYAAQSGHPGGSLSCADILSVLYFSEMNIDTKNPKLPERDRFVLSKGHCSPALYATLALKGFFPVEDLLKFRKIDSHLEGHPNMNEIMGVDMSTGSLGQGISTAVGMAISGKIYKDNYRVYVLLGDGEMQEGQVWEALMSAAHYKLNNLIAFLDYNGLQIDGKTSEVMSLGNIKDKIVSFGWNAIEIDGHNHQEILNSIKIAKDSREVPSMIIAKTIKGKGVSFMENVAGWHGTSPNKDQRDQAIDEINQFLSSLEVN